LGGRGYLGTSDHRRNTFKGLSRVDHPPPKSSLHFYTCTMLYHTSSSRYQLFGEVVVSREGFGFVALWAPKIHTRGQTRHDHAAGGEKTVPTHCIWNLLIGSCATLYPGDGRREGILSTHSCTLVCTQPPFSFYFFFFASLMRDLFVSIVSTLVLLLRQ